MSFQHFIVMTMVAAIFFAPPAKAQSVLTKSASQTLLSAEENKERNIRAGASATCVKSESSLGRVSPAESFHKKQFVVLSAAVYMASLADMHQTMHVRNQPSWFERDPLARPIVRLPAPAYYATGLTLATGVNWLSWRMGHSRRWHKLAFMSQLFSIAGNSYGFRSNHFARY